MDNNEIDNFALMQYLQFGLSVFLFLLVAFAYFLLLKTKKRAN
jgi:hypothetical protein